MAESGPIEALTHPSFPPAIDARDRHPGWFLVTVAAGLDAGIVATFAVGFGLMAVLMIISLASGNPLAAVGELQRLLAQFSRSGGHLSLHDTVAILIMLAALNTPFFVVPVMTAAFVGSRRFLVYLTAAPRFRWRMMIRAMPVMGVVLLPIFVLSTLIEPTGSPSPILSISTDTVGRLVFIVAAFVCLIPAAAAEEVLFRGWLLRQSIAFMRIPAVAIVFNGILFAAVHLNPNLDDSFQLAMMGAAFCYMSLRLGGIEFAIGAHAINNILLVLFFETLPLGGTPHHAFSWASLGAGFVTPAAGVAVTELVARWGWLRRWVGAEPTASAPGAPEPALT